ncbi:MAG: tripartite tricarboxylate transporter substrate binding protein [Comamonas sp.]
MNLCLARRTFIAVAATATLAFAASAHAAWPDRPIKIVVPSAAGGSPDILTRIFSNELGKRLGQGVVVENRPGAGGSIGMQAVMTANPDGYTLGYGNNATLATNEFLFSKLPYDPAKLVPIIALSSTGSLLVVNKDLPIQNVQELIRYVKHNPEKSSFASGGTGTTSHLGAEMFKTMTGIGSMHIPYKGAPQAINDLMGGSVQFLFDNIASVAPAVNGGKLRAIAVTSKERSAQFPNVPTLNESGVPGFEMRAWGALVAPPGTPAEIVNRINLEINAILKDEKILAQFEQLAFSPIGGTPQDLRRLVESERVKWGEVVRKSGAKVD